MDVSPIARPGEKLSDDLSFETVPYAPDDRPQVVELLSLALGHKPGLVRDAAYWEWKHEQNPVGRSLVLLAKTASGQVVGVRAFLRWRFTRETEVFEAAKPVDSVTHPQFQRRGVFRRLTLAACDLAARERLAFLFNTPNAQSRPGYLKLGWRVAGALPIAWRLLRPVSACVRLARFQGGFGAEFDEEAFFKRTPVKAGDVLGDETCLQGLLEQGEQGDGRLRTRRTLEWLRWRYTQHPHIPYYCETVEQRGQVRGAVFYRVGVRRGLQEAVIDDVLAAPDDPDVFRTLLGQVASGLRVDYLAAHVAADARRWKRTGFRTWFGPRVRLLARSMSGSLGFDLADARSWGLTLGDLEGL